MRKALLLSFVMAAAACGGGGAKYHVDDAFLVSASV